MFDIWRDSLADNVEVEEFEESKNNPLQPH